MSYVGLTPQEERRMLAAIGVDSFERLIESVPAPVRLQQPLRPPGPLPEIEARRQFGAWARENAAHRVASFLGGGLYEHYIPSAVNALAMRSEFATAYTPYQPEVAQGTLTAIYEFQSMIVELTGADVANASLYDGATAAVEAALLARHQTGRRRVVVAGALHPNYVEVLRTYLDPADVEVVAGKDGLCSAADLKSALRDDVACVLHQNPNFFGLIEAAEALNEAARAAGALAVAVCDPVSLALLEPPGRPATPQGADIVVGEGQSLGNPPSFGGPLLGFFACTQALVRRMPGRIAGETVDAQGRGGGGGTQPQRAQHQPPPKAL